MVSWATIFPLSFMASTEKPFDTLEGSFKHSKASNIWHTNHNNQSDFGLGFRIFGQRAV